MSRPACDCCADVVLCMLDAFEEARASPQLHARTPQPLQAPCSACNCNPCPRRICCTAPQVGQYGAVYQLAGRINELYVKVSA